MGGRVLFSVDPPFHLFGKLKATHRINGGVQENLDFRAVRVCFTYCLCHSVSAVINNLDRKQQKLPLTGHSLFSGCLL